MFYNDKNLLLCGLDHGFSTMKGTHAIFDNGVEQLGGEATLSNNTLIYNGKNYTPKDPLAYYRRGREKAPIHPQTKALLEKLLVMLARRGEKQTFSYIRRKILHKRR